MGFTRRRHVHRRAFGGQDARLQLHAHARRQPHGERRAAAQSVALGVDAAIVQVDQPLHEGESDSEAAVGAMQRVVGLGEEIGELKEVIDQLGELGLTILTLGQYLQPTRKHLAVARYVTPEDFARYKEVALAKGFRYVESGPMVRSSYHAEKHVI